LAPIAMNFGGTYKGNLTPSTKPGAWAELRRLSGKSPKEELQTNHKTGHGEIRGRPFLYPDAGVIVPGETLEKWWRIATYLGVSSSWIRRHKAELFEAGIAWKKHIYPGNCIVVADARRLIDWYMNLD
jgi:hypothetical protein